MDSIGYRIKTLRKKQGLSQEDIANYVGVNATTIGRFENGSTLPTSDIIFKLSELLNVSCDFLIIGGSANLQISKSESDLLTHFRNLSDFDRGILIGSLNTKTNSADSLFHTSKSKLQTSHITVQRSTDEIA